MGQYAGAILRSLVIVFVSLNLMGSSCGSKSDNAQKPCNGAPVVAYENGGGTIAVDALPGVLDPTKVRIEGNAEVCGTPTISGYVKIHGNALVEGDPVIKGDPNQADSIVIGGDAIVTADTVGVTDEEGNVTQAPLGPTLLETGQGKYYSRTTIIGKAIVGPNATIRGGHVQGTSTVSSTSSTPAVIEHASRVEGNYTIDDATLQGAAILTGSGSLKCTKWFQSGHDVSVDRCQSGGEVVTDQVSVRVGAAVIFRTEGFTLDSHEYDGRFDDGSTPAESVSEAGYPVTLFKLDDRHLVAFVPNIPAQSYALRMNLRPNFTHSVSISVSDLNTSNSLGRINEIHSTLLSRLATASKDVNLGGLPQSIVDSYLALVSATADHGAIAKILDANSLFHGENEPFPSSTCLSGNPSVEDIITCAGVDISEMITQNQIDAATVIAWTKFPELGFTLAPSSLTAIKNYLTDAKTAINIHHEYLDNQIVGTLANSIGIKRKGEDKIAFAPDDFRKEAPLFYSGVSRNIYIQSNYDNLDSRHAALAEVFGVGDFCLWQTNPSASEVVVPAKLRDAVCGMKRFHALTPVLLSGVSSYDVDSAQPGIILGEGSADGRHYTITEKNNSMPLVSVSDIIDVIEPGVGGVDDYGLNVRLTQLAGTNGLVNLSASGSLFIDYDFFSDYPNDFETEIPNVHVQRLAITGPDEVLVSDLAVTVTGNCIPLTDTLGNSVVVIDGLGVQSPTAANCNFATGKFEQIVQLVPVDNGFGDGEREISVSQTVRNGLGEDVNLSDTILYISKRCASEALAQRWTNPDGSLGGWVQNPNNVSKLAFISSNSEVCDQAQVLGAAVIQGQSFVYDQGIVDASVLDNRSGVTGFATVSNGAQVLNNSRISGGAVVSGSGVVISGGSQVMGLAEVLDFADVVNGSIISDSASVFGSAYVDRAFVDNQAIVYGNARVLSDAWITEQAQVHGSAEIRTEAVVSGRANIFGDAEVAGKAFVTDDALVHGFADIYSRANIFDRSEITGDVYSDAETYDDALVLGSTTAVHGLGTTVFGLGEVSGSSDVWGGAQVFDSGVVTDSSEVKDGSWVFDAGFVTDHAFVTDASNIEGGIVDDGEIRASDVRFGGTVEGISADVEDDSLVEFSAYIDNGDVDNFSIATGTVIVNTFGTLDNSIVCTGLVDFYLADFVEEGCFFALSSGGGNGPGVVAGPTNQVQIRDRMRSSRLAFEKRKAKTLRKARSARHPAPMSRVRSDEQLSLYAQKKPSKRVRPVKPSAAQIRAKNRASEATRKRTIVEKKLRPSYVVVQDLRMGSRSVRAFMNEQDNLFTIAERQNGAKPSDRRTQSPRRVVESGQEVSAPISGNPHYSKHWNAKKPRRSARD